MHVMRTSSRCGPGTDLGCAVIGHGDQSVLVVWTPGHAGDFTCVTTQPAIRLRQHHGTFWGVLCTKTQKGTPVKFLRFLNVKAYIVIASVQVLKVLN